MELGTLEERSETSQRVCQFDLLPGRLEVRCPEGVCRTARKGLLNVRTAERLERSANGTR